MISPVSQGSIRRRLLLTLLAGAAAITVSVFFVVQTVARQVAQESQDNILTASARSIIDSARMSGGQVNVDLPYSALSMLDSVSDERVFYAIRLGPDFLSGYIDLPQPAGASGAVATFMTAPFLGEEVRIASVQRRVSTDIGQSFLQVSVAQTQSGQKQTLARMTRTSVAIGIAFFLVSIPLAAVISHSAIRPLDRLTESVSRRGPKDLRPVAAPVPAEMAPLVASLNSFMRRLMHSLARSEDFIAEAAHRVRTPLAIVRTKAEIVQRQVSDPEIHTALREMIHAIDDSSRTAGQLLDHAMVTFRLDDLLSADISLMHLVTDTVERLGPMSELRDIRLSHVGDQDRVIQGDPILLQNALQNLIDNAIKYATPGSAICVELRTEAEGTSLSVHDTGPGFPETELGSLTRRFERGTNADKIVGSGLGLTIVEDVIQAHGGRMQISNKPGGGACVRLLFPWS